MQTAHHPRHPAIGDWSGHSAGGATGTWEASPRAASSHTGLHDPGRPIVLRGHSGCPCRPAPRRLGREQPPVTGDAVEQPEPRAHDGAMRLGTSTTTTFEKTRPFSAMPTASLIGRQAMSSGSTASSEGPCSGGDGLQGSSG